jgi:hypothetical protein
MGGESPEFGHAMAGQNVRDEAAASAALAERCMDLVELSQLQVIGRRHSENIVERAAQSPFLDAACAAEIAHMERAESLNGGQRVPHKSAIVRPALAVASKIRGRRTRDEGGERVDKFIF